MKIYIDEIIHDSYLKLENVNNVFIKYLKMAYRKCKKQNTHS